MIRPFQQDDALLQDMAAASTDESLLHVWWLGQSGFLVKWAGHSFLFDPYLSDSLTHKYAATDKPHVRMTERCLSPALLTGLDLVTASHLHTDHLDAETLIPIAQANPGLRLFLPAPIIPDAKTRLGDADLTYQALDHGTRYEDVGWSLEGIAASHNDLKTDEQGRHHYLGFILRCGPFTLYHSGDTLLHDGLVETLRPLNCDLMLLPINGYKPERRVAGNLNGTEAAALAKACRAKLVVPCHYDMFTFNTETPDEFTQACQRLQQPHRVLRCGERLTLEDEDDAGSDQIDLPHSNSAQQMTRKKMKVLGAILFVTVVCYVHLLNTFRPYWTFDFEQNIEASGKQQDWFRVTCDRITVYKGERESLAEMDLYLNSSAHSLSDLSMEELQRLMPDLESTTQPPGYHHLRGEFNRVSITFSFRADRLERITISAPILSHRAAHKTPPVQIGLPGKGPLKLPAVKKELFAYFGQPISSTRRPLTLDF